MSKDLKEYLMQVICDKGKAADNPIVREGDELYLKFDRLTFTTSGELDAYGRGIKKATFFYRGVETYTIEVGFAGPQDTMSLTGVEGRTKITFTY